MREEEDEDGTFELSTYDESSTGGPNKSRDLSMEE